MQFSESLKLINEVKLTVGDREFHTLAIDVARKYHVMAALPNVGVA